ncbi:hypothetical protein [uncultured Rhodospira sp.]|uniref:hypothetical protein n=1 Tax=uncultured Rhodospira sp. TaxID=1936189 RepID=UPI002628C38B|nr:hypothetical protein [uncultured Rhodospira sp.]
MRQRWASGLAVALLGVGLNAAWTEAAERGARHAEAGMTETEMETAGATIHAVTGLDLPEGAEVLGLREGGAIDSSLSAKVVFPPTALDRFVADLGLRPADFGETRRYLLGTNDGWWDPEAPPRLPTAHVEMAPGRVLNLGLDQRDPDRPVVYLFWHTT